MPKEPLDHNYDLKQGETVEVSGLVLAALLFAAQSYVKKKGYYDSYSHFGEIPIAYALRDGGKALGLDYDVQDRSFSRAKEAQSND